MFRLHTFGGYPLLRWFGLEGSGPSRKLRDSTNAPRPRPAAPGSHESSGPALLVLLHQGQEEP
jgi:hypothetical protein